MKTTRWSIITLIAVLGFAASAESKIDSPTDLGNAIEAGFKQRDLAIFDRVFDVDAFLDRALSNLPGSDADKRGFRTGFKNSFTRNASLRKGIEAADDYKFLRARRISTNDTLLFRLIGEGGTLNYHEHVLQRRAGGELAIVDMEIFIMGELFSRTVRRMALGALGAEKPSFLERLLGQEADIVRHSKEIQAMSQFSRDQEYDKVLATVKKLPKSLQQEKFVLVHKLAAAGQVDEPEYVRTIAQWEKLFPRDPPLISLDGYVLRKDYDTAIKLLDTMHETVGGDPYLLLLQAGQYNLKGDKAKARAAAEQAVKAEPALASAVDFLLSLSLQEKRFADTSKLLLDFENASGANMAEAIKDEPDYAAFRSSTEYAKYLEAQRKLRPNTAKDR